MKYIIIIMIIITRAGGHLRDNSNDSNYTNSNHYY